MPEHILREEGNSIALRNDRGCEILLTPENGQHGLGEFRYQGRAVGPRIPHIVKMGDKFENSANPWLKIHDGHWTPRHTAQTYEILDNTDERGAVKLSGRSGFLDVSATLEMRAGSTGIRILVTASPTRRNIWWPLFASAPFRPEAMEFVQVPLEVPLRREDSRRWAVTMRRWIAPVMIACETIDGRDRFVAAGYQLDQPRLKECILEYAPDDPNGALRVYFPGRTFARPKRAQMPTWGADQYELKMVMAMGATQAECLEGYREACGYDASTPARGSVEESLDKLLAMYRDCKVYIEVEGFKNKAYKQQISPDGGHRDQGYGRYMPIGVNVQLAYQFYLRHLARPEETWLRERAFNMAGFFCEAQRPSGAVPTLYYPAEKKPWTYNQFIRESGFLYATCQMAMGAYNLHRLAAAVERKEGIDCAEWKSAATKAADYLVNMQRQDGFLGRSYSDSGRYDDAAAPNWPLIALDYFHAATGDPKYAQSRNALEQWTEDNFARPNLWFGWSADGGNLDMEPACFNVDALDTFTYATYCVYRYQRTSDPKYLRRAEDVFAYVWACSIPTQYEGYKHLTKGLTFEQLSYQCFDVPFRTCLLVDCLPVLAAATGKRFYMDYYRLMVQTQLAYQMDPPWAAFHIGLDVDPNCMEPADDIGEKANKYIVEFASLYLEAQQSLNNYRYVGGPDWGVGVDYEMPFQVNAANDEPYVVASTHQLAGVQWDRRKKALTLTLIPRQGWPGKALIAWKMVSERAPAIEASADGEKIAATATVDDAKGVVALDLAAARAKSVQVALSA
ncbi:MAG: hypothetical protein NTW86_00655 [Candidatus Sumerlaeota bacterium]|nr:hypothetical protein [Candidatus Sumerlaeota bacterium]